MGQERKDESDVDWLMVIALSIPGMLLYCCLSSMKVPVPVVCRSYSSNTGGQRELTD